MNLTVEIISRNIATMSNFEIVGVSRFRGTEGSTRHLARDELLTVCHVSSAESGKQELKWGSYETCVTI